jgi:hypothetical protein
MKVRIKQLTRYGMDIVPFNTVKAAWPVIGDVYTAKVAATEVVGDIVLTDVRVSAYILHKDDYVIVSLNG